MKPLTGQFLEVDYIGQWQPERARTDSSWYLSTSRKIYGSTISVTVTGTKVPILRVYSD